MRKCFECDTEYPQHKLDCGSKGRMGELVWLIDHFYLLSDDLLSEISFAVYLEQMERRVAFLKEDEYGI